MSKQLNKYLSDKQDTVLDVCDVGSRDVNGTYRDLLSPKWNYTGVDISGGDNVGLIMTIEFEIPLHNNQFDVVICGQVLEHCRNPWMLVCDMTRILKQNGLLILIAPREIKTHDYPIDCYRILKDGMQSLLDQAGCEVLDVFEYPMSEGIDCCGVGRKL